MGIMKVAASGRSILLYKWTVHLHVHQNPFSPSLLRVARDSSSIRKPTPLEGMPCHTDKAIFKLEMQTNPESSEIRQAQFIRPC